MPLMLLLDPELGSDFFFESGSFLTGELIAAGWRAKKETRGPGPGRTSRNGAGVVDKHQLSYICECLRSTTGTMSYAADGTDKVPLLEKATREERCGLSSLPRLVWRRSLAPCVPVRYSLAVMSFLGFSNLYALRTNLSVAIVQMVNSTAVPHEGYNARVSRHGGRGYPN